MTGSHQMLLAGRRGGAPVASFAAGVDKAVFPTASAVSVQIFYNTDGSLTGAQGGPAGTFNDTATGKNWYAPTTPGAGNTHWCRATLLSGLPPSSGSALNTWLPLNVQQWWTYNSGTGGAVSTRVGQLTVHVATDAAGTNIVSTGTLTFSAERES